MTLHTIFSVVDRSLVQIGDQHTENLCIFATVIDKDPKSQKPECKKVSAALRTCSVLCLINVIFIWSYLTFSGPLMYEDEQCGTLS